MHPFQKNLSWVQRNLYQVAHGPVPPLQLALNVNHDWPLAPRLIQPADYVTIAGNVTTTVYEPTEGRHGLVFLAAVDSVAAIIPATDNIVMVLEDTSSAIVGVRVVEFNGTAIPAFRSVSLIGGVSNIGGFQWTGAPPVYVPFRLRLTLTHGSVAGGVSGRLRAWVLDLPEFQPLRLP